ncbi:S-layer homology domain-containing protein, partial [Butyricicoccus sp. 1XD8-22]
AASIIVKVLGLDISNVKDPGFKDVPPSHQFYPYIAALANKGIVGGYSDGRFGVNDPLRRGQMTKILVDGFQIPLIGIYNANLDKYNDVDRKYYDQNDYGRSYLAFNQPFGQYVYTMDYYGYVSGYADKTFKMNNPLTRSQLALMIEKVQKSVDQYEYFYFKDYDLTSYTQFDDMMGYEDGTQFESEDPSI